MSGGQIPGLPGIEIHPVLEDMDPLEQVLRSMEASLEADGWDLAPSLWTIGHPELGLIVKRMMLPDLVLNDLGSGLPFYARWLAGIDQAPPPAWLVERMIQTVVPQPFRGLIVFHEGWTLPQGVIEQRFEEFHQHTVHQAPDRIECRTGTAITVEGTWAVISRERGKFPEYRTMDGLAPDEMMSGRVIDAMRILCDTYEKYSSKV